jgi:hypothetical protein
MVDDTLDQLVLVVAIWKTPINNMGDYQQFIEKILDDFDEEAGSTIEPHKQCATLVFNRHIDAD